MRRWLGVALGLLALLLGLGLAVLFPWKAGDDTPTASGKESTDASPARIPPRSALLTQPLPAPRGDLSIRGAVVDAAGAPLAGAIVVATVPESEESLAENACECEDHCGAKLLKCSCALAARRHLEWATERRGEAPPQARVTTDGAGRFALEGLEAGRYAVWADAPAGGVGLLEGVTAGGEEVQVRVGVGAVLAGQVTNDDEAPVGDALVTVLDVVHRRYFEQLSDASGRFRVGPLPGRTHAVVVSREGLLPSRLLVDTGASEALRVSLFRPRPLSGRVFLDDAPVVGARVHLSGAHRELETPTDEQGRFTFDGLGPGPYTLTASQAGLGADGTAILRPRTDPPEVVLLLGARFPIRGTVRDSRGRPVAGAEVGVWEGSPRPLHTWRRVKTGADGTYTLPGLEVGVHRFQVSAEGLLGTGVEDHAVAPGMPPLDFTLADAALIEGLVVDEAGQPLADTEVSLSDLDPPEPTLFDEAVARAPAARMKARTKEDGLFSLVPPRPGPWRLSASRTDRSLVEQTVTAPVSGLRWVLRTGITVTGEVVDARDAPLPEAQVTIWPASDFFAGPRARQGTTDAAGRFTVRGLDEGPHVVVARASPVPRGGGMTQDVELRPPSVHLRLQLGEGLTLSGRVTDSRGQPLPGVALILETGLRSGDTARRSRPGTEVLLDAARSMTSGDDGRFEARNLRSGAWTLWPHLEGYTLESGERLRVQAGDSDVRVVMRRQARLQGRVVRDDGTPVTRFEVDSRPVHDEAGAFSVPITRSGPRTIHFAAPTLASTHVRVEAREGEDQDLGDVVLGTGRQVSGTVTDATTGAPVVGARLEYEGGQGLTNGSGAFLLSNVSEEARSLLVSHAAYPATRFPLGAGPQRATLTLEGGGHLKGLIQGARVEGANILVASLDQSFTDTIRSKGGTFERRGLAPGAYVVSAFFLSQGPDTPSFTPQQFQVSSGATTTVVLEPRRGGVTLRLRAPEPRDQTHLFLVPGAIEAPASQAALQRVTRLAVIPAGTEEWLLVYRSVAPGPYTVLAVRTANGAMEVGRDDLIVSEGDLVHAVTPRWSPLPGGAGPTTVSP